MILVLQRLGPGGAEHLECRIELVRLGMDSGSAWVDAPLNQRAHLNSQMPIYESGIGPISVAMVEMPTPYHLVELPLLTTVTLTATVWARGERPWCFGDLHKGGEVGAPSTINLSWDESGERISPVPSRVTRRRGSIADRSSARRRVR